VAVAVVPRDRRELLVRLVEQDLQEAQDLQDHKEVQDHKVLRVLQVAKDRRV